MELYIENLDIKNQRIIGGNIFVSVNGCYFPGENWYDAVELDLAIWLPRLLSFADGHTDTCIFSFLDSSSYVKLKRLPNNVVTVVCLCDRRLEIPETVIDFSAFLKSTVKALRHYQRMLHVHGMIFSDGDILSRLVNLSKQVSNAT